MLRRSRLLSGLHGDLWRLCHPDIQPDHSRSVILLSWIGASSLLAIVSATPAGGRNSGATESVGVENAARKK